MNSTICRTPHHHPSPPQAQAQSLTLAICGLCSILWAGSNGTETHRSLEVPCKKTSLSSDFSPELVAWTFPQWAFREDITVLAHNFRKNRIPPAPKEQGIPGWEEAQERIRGSLVHPCDPCEYTKSFVFFLVFLYKKIIIPKYQKKKKKLFSCTKSL